LPGAEITAAAARKLAKLKPDFLAMDDDRASSFVESLRGKRRKPVVAITAKEPKAPKIAKVKTPRVAKVPKAKKSKKGLISGEEKVEVEVESEIKADTEAGQESPEGENGEDRETQEVAPQEQKTPNRSWADLKRENAARREAQKKARQCGSC
jgi:hypothetical protein